MSKRESTAISRAAARRSLVEAGAVGHAERIHRTRVSGTVSADGADTINGMSARAELASHLRRHSLRTDGPYTLASGAVADWYLDARRTTFSGQGAALVGRAVLEVLDPEAAAVGGMTMGADPIAVATAVLSEGRLDAFSIRKTAKEHGTGGRLVGPVEAGLAVTVVEDTTTTGAALLEAVVVAAEHGLRVVQALSLFDRSGGRVAGLMEARSIPYLTLVSPSHLGVEV